MSDASSIRVVDSPHITSEQAELCDGSIVLEPNVLDKAIIGTWEIQTTVHVFVYEYNKVVHAFCDLFDETDDSDGWNAAMEWVDYNTIRAIPYMGEKAPLVVSEIVVEEFVDEEAMVIEMNGKRYEVVS